MNASTFGSECLDGNNVLGNAIVGGYNGEVSQRFITHCLPMRLHHNDNGHLICLNVAVCQYLIVHRHPRRMA